MSQKNPIILKENQVIIREHKTIYKIAFGTSLVSLTN